VVNDEFSPPKFDAGELSDGFPPTKFDKPDLSKPKLKTNWSRD